MSECLIPAILVWILGNGIAQRRNVYEDFLEGAREGAELVWKMVPMLVGLLVSVGILRASGFLEEVVLVGKKVLAPVGAPVEILPLTVVRLFSSSAATGLLLDLFKRYGTDSRIGFTASLILNSTESVFYCLAVYYSSVKIRKTRYTVPGALLATAGGIAASILIGGNKR